MTLYRFEAANPAGGEERGVVEADSLRHARSLIRARGLSPLLLEEQGSKPTVKTSWFQRGISTSERVLFIRHLASLLGAGVPLDEVLSAVAAQSEGLLQDRILSLRSEVLSGSSLARALSLYPRDFPPLWQALIAAGEQSGQLGWVLERLADYAQTRDDLNKKMLSALAYPVVVTVVAVAIVLFLMTTVVPQVVAVFANNHQTLPLLTRVLISLSSFLQNWGLLLLVLIAATLVLAARLLQRPEIRLRWDEQLLHWPLVGGLVRGYDTERFASTLSILVSGGVPILTALQGAKDTLSSTALRQTVQDALVRVREGAGLARALGVQKRFSPILLQLIAAGESTGQLPQMLERAAKNESTALERKLMLLTALMEPALILIMGLVVALIVLAILMPIMDINQMIH
jgi:general secretion pathway protein F